MTSSYKDLVSQREQLDQEIDRARTNELDHALKTIHDLMVAYAITPSEIIKITGNTNVRSPRPKVMPKYRDPITFCVWSGRGKPPSWIKGRDRETFLIKSDAVEKLIENHGDSA